MSSLKISENEPYIITLDSLDLKYIHANINTNMAGVQPRWNNTQKNYYEFVVVADSESEEETNCNDKMSYQICHICNVDVPVIFLNEHLKSEKHELFKKLTITVLERASKNIDTYININTNNISNMYYCKTCSVAVSKRNILNHDQSKEHLDSHKYQECMRSLINLYTNDNDKMNYKNDNVKTNIKNHDNEMNKKKADGKINYTKYNKEMKAKNDNRKTNSENDNDERLKKSDSAKKIVIVNFEKERAKLISNIVNDTAGTSKMTENEQEITKIIQTTGYTINYRDIFITVPQECYHGIVTRTHGNVSLYNCKLCCCTLKENIDVHIESLNHRSKCDKPINQYLLREINSIFSHCIICNIIMKTNDFPEHVAGNSPHKRLLETLIRRTKKTVEPTKPPEETYCKPHYEYSSGYTHVPCSKNRQHTPVAIKNKKSTYISDGYIINHITNGSNPNQLECHLCKVIVPNTERNISEHISAKTHVTNLFKSKTFRFYCEACNVEFDDIIVHTFDKNRLCT